MPTAGFNAAVIIPTGIGASIGGFGGDAMTLLPLLASVCDTVITHPNVANAACFQQLPSNTLYVEGYALDRFFKGDWSLVPSRQNRIGILWDSGIPHDMEVLHRNTIAAVETVYGVSVTGLEKTRTPVQSQVLAGESGRSTGLLTNPEVLLEAGRRLLEKGATALAVCCLMPDVEDKAEEAAYLQGEGVDPIAGLEAMISHFLVSKLQVPAAHAPVFPYEKALPITDELVDPRAASEFIVSTFLPCVLTGLSRAPQFRAAAPQPGDLRIQHLSALLVPGDALGGIPVLAALERNIPILAIQNNESAMACPPDALGLEDKVIRCQNYLEAIGWLVALKAGIFPPKHITAPSAVTATLQAVSVSH